MCFNNFYVIHLQFVISTKQFNVETQRRRHQKSKTGVSVAPQKGLLSSTNFKKKQNNLMFPWIRLAAQNYIYVVEQA